MEIFLFLLVVCAASFVFWRVNSAPRDACLAGGVHEMHPMDPDLGCRAFVCAKCRFGFMRLSDEKPWFKCTNEPHSDEFMWRRDRIFMHERGKLSEQVH